jgi:hypothetical protein
MLDNIKELWLIHQAIHDIFLHPLLLKSAKDPVPDRQPATIVLIQAIPGNGVGATHEHQAVLPVGPMVHTVVRGCVQDIAKRSQVTQQLGVDQELVEEVEL